MTNEEKILGLLIDIELRLKAVDTRLAALMIERQLRHIQIIGLWFCTAIFSSFAIVLALVWMVIP
jgi:hypothetical protein